MLQIETVQLWRLRRLWEIVRFTEEERLYGTYRALVMYGTRIGAQRTR